MFYTRNLILKLNQGIKINVQQFLVELIKMLLKLTSSIDDSYDNLLTFQRSFIRKSNDVPNPPMLTTLRRLGIHEPDDYHIASAICHENNSNEKTIFVTLDFATILNKRHLIRKQTNIECCGPLYALHHLV